MSIGDTAQLARRCERLGSFVGRGAELDQVRLSIPPLGGHLE